MDNPTTSIIQLLAPFQHSVFGRLARKSNIPILKVTPLILFQFGCTCVGKGLTLGFVCNLFKCIDNPTKPRHRAYESDAWQVLCTVVTKLQYIYETAGQMQDISAQAIIAHSELEAYRCCMSIQQEKKGSGDVLTFSFGDLKCLNCTSYVRKDNNCCVVSRLFLSCMCLMLPFATIDSHVFRWLLFGLIFLKF